jgi:serine/threonine protein kinase
MADVYLAEDSSLSRKVAIKFLAAKLEGDKLSRARLLREAKSAASLDHPFICNIIEVGKAERGDFIAMEYVDGQTRQNLMGYMWVLEATSGVY